MAVVSISEAENVIAQGTTDRVTLGEIADLFGEGSIGTVLLMLTLPNITIIPSIPLLPFIVGGPAIAVCVIYALMGEVPTLPLWVAALSVKRCRAAKVAHWVGKATFFTKERYEFLTEGICLRVNCAVAALLTLALCLLPPGLNMAPGFGLMVMALGLAEADGLVMLCGLILGLGGCIGEWMMASNIIHSLPSVL